MNPQPDRKELTAVLGATGTIGSAVVAQLTEAGHAVRVAVRDPARAVRFGSLVDVVEADLERPETLKAAFAGVRKAFILSNGPGIALEPRAFAAAKTAGATHIVRISAQEAEFPEVAQTPLGQAHIESERQLRESGLAWTLLRPSFFSSNVLVPFLFDLREGVSLPSGGGKEAPIDPRDIAAVAVRVLTASGHENQTYVLTGPELLSFAEMTEKLSAAIRRPLKHVVSSEAATRSRFLAAGIPVPFVESVLGHFSAIRSGRTYLTQTVDQVLGRPSRSYDDWIGDNIAVLRSRTEGQS